MIGNGYQNLPSGNIGQSLEFLNIKLPGPPVLSMERVYLNGKFRETTGRRISQEPDSSEHPRSQ